MTSEEYVEQVNRLMDLQNTYLVTFLTILIAGIGLVVLFQWRFNSRQLQRLKEEAKKETIKEVEESLGVLELKEFRSKVNNDIKELEKMNNIFGHTQLDYELTKFYTEKKEFLWHISYLMDIYKNNILSSFNDFNYFVSRIDSLILISIDENIVDIDIHSDHIDNILRKMTDYESTFNKKSETLERFRNQITYIRNQEK